MKTKNTLIAIGLTVVFTVGATLAVQNYAPTKKDILEKSLSQVNSDIAYEKENEMRAKQRQNVLSERKADITCQFGAQKLADGQKLKNPKVFSQLCAEELGLN